MYLKSRIYWQIKTSNINPLIIRQIKTSNLNRLVTGQVKTSNKSPCYLADRN